MLYTLHTYVCVCMHMLVSILFKSFVKFWWYELSPPTTPLHPRGKSHFYLFLSQQQRIILVKA